ncbi:DUF1707 domain-containing protein [Williamsia sp. D3]|uniref:DUF1707 SHOCT-like domain-containing protein n=1 Tax=Williamsia sp. D3 TaxID=1313067 RepID=UPI0003D3626C|nr:DUF1707 domain-containing protein [Williamsia sp. D3]ETD32158.1 membrane protein [Williamsia sp. D3]
MDDDKTRDIRIGNDERGRALDALGEHFTSGRLDHTEYEERVQLAAAAHTRSELDKLFGDLPEPTPFGSESSAPALARDSSPTHAPRNNSVQRAPGKKLIQTLNLFAGGGTLLLFLLLQVVFGVPNAWLVFIVFPLVLGGIRIWSGQADGDDGDYDDTGHLDQAELRRRREIESRRRRDFGY